MSLENVEIVRQVFDAEARRDTGTLRAFYDPNVEMDFSDSPFADFTQPVLCGLDEARSAFKDFYAAFRKVEADVLDLIDAGEHVISVFTYKGTGRASGVETQWTDMAGLWTFRDGKIVRVVWLRSREHALGAVGMSE